MTHRQTPLAKPFQNFAGQFQQTECVGDAGALLSNAFGGLLLGEAELRQESLIGMGLVHRVEIFPLNVFNQGEFQRLMFADFTYESRNPGQAGPLGRPPAPFTSDDLEHTVLERTHDQRLNDTVGDNGSREII